MDADVARAVAEGRGGADVPDRSRTRRIRVGLRREREELKRGGIGCRHVVEARAGRR